MSVCGLITIVSQLFFIIPDRTSAAKPPPDEPSNKGLNPLFLEKDKIISEDDNKNSEKNTQKLTDLNIENIEKILTEKEKEIIQI